MSKPLLLIVLFCLFSLNGTSQEWQTDFEAAKTMAKESDNPIILVFQGSDWCAPCIKLDREVWSTSIFKAYAKEHYVMLQADFPRKKKNALSKELADSNTMLAEKYNQKGIFPLVVLLDSYGRELGRTGYKRLPPMEYIEELNRYLN
ncbi:thioredoxin family protein [Maribacter chungangensis]|uniref:Thioredoxin family protein n=1 Tax=Maribacter chungangensis TaxID=1069117 RepID=A0ABW3B8F7_9FLAO